MNTSVVRFSELSAPRQALVRACQLINFGSLQDFEVRGGEPYFGAESELFVDEKLDVAEAARPEANVADFAINDAIRRLLERIDQVRNGKIARLEIRAGKPCRVIFRHRVSNGADDTRS